jgi:hypothetical protein
VALSITSLDVKSLEYQPGMGCGVLYSETCPFQMVKLRRLEGLALRVWRGGKAFLTCP